MTKQKLIFYIEEMEAINFCKVLGKYGAKFEISDLRSTTRADDETKKRYYRIFTVYASKKQVDEMRKNWI